jgi:hypothetical protein
MLLVIICFFPATAKSDLANLAPIYGIASTNSSYNGGPNEVYSPPYTPDRAIDGNLDTQWNAGSWPNANSPFWVIVNLQNMFEVDKIVLYSKDTYYSDYYYESYNLFSSLDGANWNLLQSGNLVDNAVLFRSEIPLSAILQYVKVEIPAGTHWAHLNEIQIYGNTSPVPIPGAVWLLGSGLVGLLAIRKKLKK